MWSRTNALEVISQQRTLFKLLVSVHLFDGFTREELTDLLAQTHKRVFAAGERILQEGEPGRFMYVILAGRVQIAKELGESRRQSLANLAAGDSFGEMSMIDEELRSASAVALTDCTLLRIGDGEFWQCPQIAAKLYKNIALSLSRRLRDTTAVLSLRH